MPTKRKPVKKKKVEKRSHKSTAAFLTICAIILLLGGFFIGYEKGKVENTGFKVEGISDIGERGEDPSFSIFWEAWEILQDVHINAAEVSAQDYIYAAVQGLAGVFNDPYTVFFPPTEAQKFKEDVSGKFYGIGAEIGIGDSGYITVVAPLKDSPAEKEGVQTSDIIIEIDGTKTDGMSTEEAVNLIRGEKGVAVVLTIVREDEVGSQEITIVRDQIKVPTIEVEYVGEGESIAHIRLFSFNENAYEQVSDALEEARGKGVDGVVLDLRSNPGGFLQVANQIAGLFVERGTVVVTERFKTGKDREFTANGSARYKDMPLVVLINQGSASASEILAGALRDIKGTKLVGMTSFGKGTVQELIELSDNSSLKITIAQWEMPAGDILTEDGISPDIEVDFTKEDFDNEVDPQLEAAIQELQGE
ncbi:MAG: S41 family peptidase [Candidatus Paceibacterota bacterium]